MYEQDLLVMVFECVCGWASERACVRVTLGSLLFLLCSGPETQVLDYQTQQFKLLPLVASAYALCFAGLYMMRMHLEFQAEIYGGNLESLPEVRAGLFVVGA